MTSGLAIWTVVEIDSFYESSAVELFFLYAFDVLAMFALLWVFRRGVSALNPDQKKDTSTDNSRTQTDGSSKQLKTQGSSTELIQGSKVGRDVSPSVSTAEGTQGTSSGSNLPRDSNISVNDGAATSRV